MQHLYIALLFPGMFLKYVSLIISRMMKLSLGELESNICFAWDPDAWERGVNDMGKSLGDEALGHRCGKLD